MNSKLFLRFLIGSILLLQILWACSHFTKPYDIVIKSGEIVDGTGNPGYRADIGIKGERIIQIGVITEDEGKKVIDAEGLCVAPGFIDVHTHTDRRIDTHPEVKNYLLQGVTTVVGGNCGGSRFPLKKLFKGTG